MAGKWYFPTYLKRLRPETKHTVSLRETAEFLTAFHQQGQICPCGEETTDESISVTSRVLKLSDYARCESCASIILFLRIAEYRMRVRYLRSKAEVKRKAVKGGRYNEYVNAGGLTVGQVIELSQTKIALHLAQSAFVRLKRRNGEN